MSKWEVIVVPQISVNDDTVVLNKWLIKESSKVEQGEAIAELETSKSTVELESNHSGYLFPLLGESESVTPGTNIAIVSSVCDRSIVQEYRDSLTFTDISEECKSRDLPEGIQLTKKARELAIRLNIDFGLLPQGRILREKDILKINENSMPESIREEKIDVSPMKVANNSILIYGGGGHAKMCIDIIRQMKVFNIYGIIDTELEIGSRVLGVPVVGRNDDLTSLFNKGIRFIINGVGAADNHSVREKIYKMFKDIGFLVPNLIHPTASVEPSVRMGEGNQVMANAVIGSDAVIGNNCIINSSSIVSHDCNLGDNVHITPGAILAGSVRVGDNSLIGMGATILMKVKIGMNVTVFNNVNITYDIADNNTVKK